MRTERPVGRCRSGSSAPAKTSTSAPGAEPGGWFRAAQASHAARVRAGGVERDVDLVDAGHEVNDADDAAYRDKYGRYRATRSRWSPNRFMVHIAIQQNDETGTAVVWGEHVTDEQYGG